MYNQPPGPDPAGNPVQLHPIDQEVLELSGGLPNLPLLLNPAIAEKLSRPPPSVHTIETSLRNSTEGAEGSNPRHLDPDPYPDSDRQDYTYRGYLLQPRMDAYVRAREIYADVDGGFSGKFSSRLQQCRKYAWFMQSSLTNKLKVMSSRCKLRWCPICRDVSRLIVTTGVRKWLDVQRYPKMITLTLKHSDDPLTLQIKRLYDSFKKLRTRAYFQRLITGGVWFFQLKFNQATEQWHPHIHCLVAGKFIPHNRLKNLWLKITGDSYVVDVRPVKDVESCASEVARYATSPADITAVNLERALEIFWATKHRRICGSWGTARSIVLKPKPLEDVGEWTKVADFYWINVAKEYDPAAKDFWTCFKQDLPYEGPQLQKLTDVYEDELYVMRHSDKDIIDIKTFIAMVTKGRDKDWQGFYYSDH